MRFGRGERRRLGLFVVEVVHGHFLREEVVQFLLDVQSALLGLFLVRLGFVLGLLVFVLVLLVQEHQHLEVVVVGLDGVLLLLLRSGVHRGVRVAAVSRLVEVPFGEDAAVAQEVLVLRVGERPASPRVGFFAVVVVVWRLVHVEAVELVVAVVLLQLELLVDLSEREERFVGAVSALENPNLSPELVGEDGLGEDGRVRGDAADHDLDSEGERSEVEDELVSRSYVVVLFEVRLRVEAVDQRVVVLEDRQSERELARTVQVVQLLLDLLDDVRVFVLRVEQRQRERGEDRMRRILDKACLPAA